MLKKKLANTSGANGTVNKKAALFEIDGDRRYARSEAHSSRFIKVTVVAPPAGKSPPFHLHSATFQFTPSGLRARRDPSVRTENGGFSAKLGNASARWATFQPPAPFYTRVHVGQRAQGKGHGFSAKTALFFAMLIAHQPPTAPEYAFHHKNHHRSG